VQGLSCRRRHERSASHTHARHLRSMQCTPRARLRRRSVSNSRRCGRARTRSPANARHAALNALRRSCALAHAGRSSARARTVGIAKGQRGKSARTLLHHCFTGTHLALGVGSGGRAPRRSAPRSTPRSHLDIPKSTSGTTTLGLLTRTHCVRARAKTRRSAAASRALRKLQPSSLEQDELRRHVACLCKSLARLRASSRFVTRAAHEGTCSFNPRQSVSARARPAAAPHRCISGVCFRWVPTKRRRFPRTQRAMR
jgi:hypothetical protein